MRFILLILFILTSINAHSFKDLYNRDVNIKQNKKIVCIGPGTLRFITYLNLEKNLVGIEKRELKFNKNSTYTQYLDKEFIKSLPIIGQGGPGKMPNLEALITLKPDIIFATFLSKEQINLIESKTKIPVVALSYGQTLKNEKKLDFIKNSLNLISKIMKKEKRFQELETFMQKEEKNISKLKVDDKLMYVGGVAFKGIQGITSTDSDYPAFELLNIKNHVLKNHKGHAFINIETLLTYNPEIIFFDKLSKKIINEEIEKNKVIFNNINAFKNKKVYWLNPSNFYNINVENIYINSYLIASKFGYDNNMENIKTRVHKAFFTKE
ncbi:ABC transporter substrate-binding protein [Halarcobacter sp.]|uniref:ABC transporter substrate-binding protein n=1 Tax=Halarcobacter sp. TaxID=2321133 RepID=UPI002AA75EE3|nr:ABC transporter substrate-binding protein [Halarcobacter sp.]